MDCLKRPVDRHCRRCGSAHRCRMCDRVVYGRYSGSATGLAGPGCCEARIIPRAERPAHAVASSGTPGVTELQCCHDLRVMRLGDIAVPDKGVFIRILYRGGYAGTWASGNRTGELQNSGERLVAIENPGSSLSAELRETGQLRPAAADDRDAGRTGPGGRPTAPPSRSAEVTVSANLQDA